MTVGVGRRKISPVLLALCIAGLVRSAIPNVFHNVYGGLRTVNFVEFYRPTASAQWIYEVFSFELPEGYDETAALITTMQAKFSNASGSEITRESDGSTNVQHVGQTYV